MAEGIHAAVLEALAKFSEHYGTIIVSVAAVVLATVVISNVRASKWARVPYTVPIPEQCKRGWEGKVLENPSIKVCSLWTVCSLVYWAQLTLWKGSWQ